MRTRRYGLAGLAAALMGLSCAFWVAPASGQGGMVFTSGPISGPGGRDEVTAARLASYMRVLGFDESQRSATKDIHEGYLELIRSIDADRERAIRDARRDAEEGDTSSLIEALPKAIGEAASKKRKATASLLEDLRAMLTPEQHARWASLERLRRRESGLVSSVSGAGVDLVALIEELRMPEEVRTATVGILAEYELELDGVLRGNEREMAKLDEKAGGGGAGMPRVMDFATVREREEAERKGGVRVRDVNKRYASRLAEGLPGEWKDRLLSVYRERAFRRVYRESHAMTALRTALKFDDLDADQRRRLEELLGQHEREAARLNARWAEALEKAETEGTAGGAFDGLPGMEDRTSEDLKAARAARSAYDRQTEERLGTILTPGQKERLPKRRQGNGPVIVTPNGDEVEAEVEFHETGSGGGVRIMRMGPGGG
ncbi:MAG: hypothetical protein HRU70_09545 [Phycisphaeraceae bacterium]|nr:MAG: hypothetical protein HRU70_09545 [Phycisphaeraceae bacterium]